MTDSNLPSGFVFAERYSIIKLLGKGGMGAVYLAEDQLIAGDRVALKVLPAEFTKDERQVQRFLREVQLARKITSNHVVKTFDVNIWQGQPFFTMELVEGQSLKEKIGQQGLPQALVSRYLKEICLGLKVIHDSGVIHRDLKPANIMITKDDQIKIADFGIAHPGSSDLTGKEEVIGSNHYIAPEVWSGKEVDNRSDIYALGIITYEMLTGILPYDGDSPAQIMYKHLAGKATAPNLVQDDIPSWISDLCLQMMALKSEDRPQYAEDILAEIAKADTGAAKSAAGESVSVTASGRFGYQAANRGTDSDLIWSSPESRGERIAGSGFLGGEKKILNPGFGAKNLQAVEQERKLLPKVAEAFSWQNLLTKKGFRLALAFLIAGIFLFLLIGPLGALQKSLWDSMLSKQGSLGGTLVFTSLANIIFYALALAAPIFILSAFYQSLKTSFKNYFLASLIFSIFGFLQSVYLSVLALLKYKEFHDKFDFSLIVTGIQTITNRAVQTLCEVVLLMPQGTFFKAVIQRGLPEFVKDSAGELSSMLPYYAMLLLVILILAIFLLTRILEGAQKGLIISALIIGLIFCMAIEIGLQDLIGKSFDLNIKSEIGGIFGVYYLSFNRYMLVCSLINWLVIALFLFVLFPFMNRRENIDTGISQTVGVLTNKKK